MKVDRKTYAVYTKRVDYKESPAQYDKILVHAAERGLSAGGAIRELVKRGLRPRRPLDSKQ